MRSVLNQSYRHVELILVNDGSTDDTAKLVQRFNDARISYLEHRHNRGAAAARNAGLRLARGKLLAFQDSDDEWLPDKLEKQLRALDSGSPELGAVYCAYTRIQPDGSEQRVPRPGPERLSGNLHGELLLGNFIGTPTLLVRREALDEAGTFDERLPRFQDWELMIRISRKRPIGFVDEPLVRAYVCEDRITAGHSAALVEAERLILDKHLAWFEEAGPEVLGFRFWHLAHLLFMRGEMAEGRRWLRRARSVDRRLKYLALGVLSWSAPIYRLAYRARPTRTVTRT
jgi:glycosyltransferase involved in cell wall biosynthesis